VAFSSPRDFFPLIGGEQCPALPDNFSKFPLSRLISGGRLGSLLFLQASMSRPFLEGRTSLQIVELKFMRGIVFSSLVFDVFLRSE